MVELIEWYRARWEIELFFLVFKEGCRVEALQLSIMISAQLLEPLRQPTHPLQALAPTTRQHIEVVAAGCADLFQGKGPPAHLYFA